MELHPLGVDLEVHRPVTPADAELVRQVADAAGAADGHPAVGDSVWRDLAEPTDASALVVARVDGAVAGVVHVGAAENEPDHRTGALVLDPGHRVPDVLGALVDRAARRDVCGPAERLSVWMLGADDAVDALLWQVGATRARELFQMRVPLPLAERPDWPAGVTPRTFVPGRDEDAWLRVNNRAFADDPDQHGWTPDVLHTRESEAWFEPEGFLLAVTGTDEIVGFCWTKRHAPAPPIEPDPLGEIYVIGVDPAHQGTGLGRALVVAGLASLHDRGSPTGMLFVDAANRGAVALYRKLGFDVSRADRAYERVVM